MEPEADPAVVAVRNFRFQSREKKGMKWARPSPATAGSVIVQAFQPRYTAVPSQTRLTRLLPQLPLPHETLQREDEGNLTVVGDGMGDWNHWACRSGRLVG